MSRLYRDPDSRHCYPQAGNKEENDEGEAKALAVFNQGWVFDGKAESPRFTYEAGVEAKQNHTQDAQQCGDAIRRFLRHRHWSAETPVAGQGDSEVKMG